MGKNGWKSTKMSKIWKKMGNPMPFERVMGLNRHNMENYGNLQPIAQRMKLTLWVPSENLSFGLLPNMEEQRFSQSFQKLSSYSAIIIVGLAELRERSESVVS